MGMAVPTTNSRLPIFLTSGFSRCAHTRGGSGKRSMDSAFLVAELNMA